MIDSDLWETNSYIDIKGKSYRLKDKIRAALASEDVILKAHNEAEPEQEEKVLSENYWSLSWSEFISQVVILNR